MFQTDTLRKELKTNTPTEETKRKCVGEEGVLQSPH